jgi:hypothetical protein
MLYVTPFKGIFHWNVSHRPATVYPAFLPFFISAASFCSEDNYVTGGRAG